MKTFILFSIVFISSSLFCMDQQNLSAPKVITKQREHGKQKQQLYGRTEYKLQNNPQEKTFKIPLKDEYILHIKNGNKTVEGRIFKGVFKSIKPKDIIHFFSRNSSVHVKVNEINKHKDFPAMLIIEGVSKMLPGMDDVKDINKAIDLYRSFPGYSEQEKVHGVVAVHLSLLK